MVDSNFPQQSSGQRFSLRYLERGAPGVDSPRFRRRIAQEFARLVEGWQEASDFGKFLQSEAGTDVPSSGGTFRPKRVFEEGEVRDVLDGITLFYQFLADKRLKEVNTFKAVGYRATAFRTEDPAQWLAFVGRAMREENVAYRVDEKCGVHYFIDGEFEHNRAATVAALEDPLLANARANFEDAFKHLDSQPRDTTAAVRSIFIAAEIIAKQICPTAQLLNKKLVEGELKARCVATVEGDDTEKKVLEGMFDSFAAWVNPLHNYRHGQASSNHVVASEELTVLALSTGSAYVRLLANSFLRIQASS